MANQDNDWNIWRGEQSAILKLTVEELKSMRNDIQNLSKEIWVIKGKSVAYGAISGSVVGLIITLIGGFLK